MGRRRATSAPAENGNLQQRVAHQPVVAVHTTAHLASDEQARYLGGAIGLQLHTTVLVVEGGVDQHRLLRDVYLEASKLAHHRRQGSLDSTRTVEHLDHR